MSATSIPEDTTTNKKLNEMSGHLNLPIPERLSADLKHFALDGATYNFEANGFNAESVSFHFKKDSVDAVFSENGKTILVQSGLTKWVTGEHRKEGNTLFAIKGRTPMPTKISSYCYWTDDKILKMKLKYVENIHADIFTFAFTDQGLELTFNNSLSLFANNPDDRPALKASRVA